MFINNSVVVAIFIFFVAATVLCCCSTLKTAIQLAAEKRKRLPQLFSYYFTFVFGSLQGGSVCVCVCVAAPEKIAEAEASNWREWDDVFATTWWAFCCYAQFVHDGELYKIQA